MLWLSQWYMEHFPIKNPSFSILAHTVFFTGTFQLNNRIYKFLFNLRINMNILINIAINRKKNGIKLISQLDLSIYKIYVIKAIVDKMAKLVIIVFNV